MKIFNFAKSINDNLHYKCKRSITYVFIVRNKHTSFNHTRHIYIDIPLHYTGHTHTHTHYTRETHTHPHTSTHYVEPSYWAVTVQWILVNHWFHIIFNTSSVFRIYIDLKWISRDYIYTHTHIYIYSTLYSVQCINSRFDCTL